MKILVAGTFRFPMYQEALCYGIEQNGHEAVRLVLGEGRPYNLCLCSKNARELSSAITRLKPDAVFLYRVENIWSSCIKRVKKDFPNIPIAIYHNDDPFRKKWKRYIKSVHYLNCVKHADITYVYRQINIEEAYQRGSKQVKLFMSHYNSKTDFVELSDDFFDKRTDEVAFVGHYEKDSRVEIINYLLSKGINIHIYGSDWKKVFIEHRWPIERWHPSANGIDYKKTIQKVGIALAFFSSKNRDEYTRRCFEIPIMGTMIAAPYTSITKEIYKDGENALLFENKEDLYEKLKYYSTHIQERNEITKQGYFNIKNGAFSEISRAKMVIEDFKTLIIRGLNECS